MRTRATVVAAVALLVALPSLADPGALTSKIYRDQEAKQLSEEGYAHQLKGAAPYWTPSAEQVQDLERALPGFLERAWPEGQPPIENLEAYLRQYFGISRDGRRIIFLNAACASYASTNPKWRDSFIFVFDGGSCFFQLEYEPSTKQFRNLSVNGFG